ncbi:MAG: phosphoribosylformylglycinamidine cyclo-ligase [Clostridiales Family XIII bacterium]|jgi:phosphoribosylformylglycinamidine cyclo-ligase|nr:phosphoribosylformylglycinamidine cyclo-ligase [Clostridiales Family XIII bacterium]
MGITYKDAGVDTEEGARAVTLMKEHVKKTFGPEVLGGIGGFGSLYKPNLSGIGSPVLVAGSDGVGTKLKVAILMDKHNTVGQDLVAMCVNDVLCQGARPLFFLDYVATGSVFAEKIAEIVGGVADGCVLAQCALVGGETAEMPGFYGDGDYDMAGFAVGLVDEDKIVDGQGIAEGDLLIGIASSGVHSNGFSLVRKIFFDANNLNVDAQIDGLSASLGETLLTPTRIYTKQVLSVLARVQPKAMIHITGGGFHENIPRVIPAGLGAQIERGSWSEPPIFGVLRKYGNLDDKVMFSTFNMGIGLIFVVAEADGPMVIESLDAVGEEAFTIGKIVRGEGVTFS